MFNDLPKDNRILFLDMNSFFTSIEQQVRPELRGKPVIVTPHTGVTGCVIAASYEAKRLGVKVGMKVGEAKNQSVRLEILASRPSLYHVYHREIVKVLNSFSPFLSVLSIDEMAIHLKGKEQLDYNAFLLASEVKRKIKKEVGDYLTCSIGIGPSKFLAKTAGERKKPDGLTFVKLKDLEDFYSSLKLTDLPGINRRMALHCLDLPARNPLELFKLSLETLCRQWGLLGKVWYYRLRGYEVDNSQTTTKSIGHSYVLPPELRTWPGVEAVLIKLIHKAGYRLRQSKLYSQGISLSISFLAGGRWHQSRKFAPFSSDHEFKKNAFELFKNCPKEEKPLLIAVSAINLTQSTAKPVSLFSEIRKIEEVSQVMDSINDKYGASSIFPSSMCGAEESAPDRIPFGQPRYDIRNE